MKNKQLANVAIVMLVVMFSLIPLLLLAQPCPGGGPEEYPNCPIDGGISLLLAAGVGYGVKRYRDARKKDKAATA